MCTSLTLILPNRSLLVINTVLIGVVTTVLAITNVSLYRFARAHEKFVHRNTARSKNTVVDRKVLKASYVCITIVSSFVVLWSPLLVSNAMLLYNAYYFIDGHLVVGSSSMLIFMRVAEHMAVFNSAADSILFVWLSKDVQAEMKHILRRLVSLPKENIGRRNDGTVPTRVS